MVFAIWGSTFFSLIEPYFQSLVDEEETSR